VYGCCLVEYMNKWQLNGLLYQLVRRHQLGRFCGSTIASFWQEKFYIWDESQRQTTKVYAYGQQKSICYVLIYLHIKNHNTIFDTQTGWSTCLFCNHCFIFVELKQPFTLNPKHNFGICIILNYIIQISAKCCFIEYVYVY